MPFRATTAVLCPLLLLPIAAVPCHMPENLRGVAHLLTAEQLKIRAHGGSDLAPIPYKLGGPTACVDGFADIFPCKSVDIEAFVPLSSIGGGSGSDLWGWTDPLTQREYALVGRSGGTSFLDVTNPQTPVFLGNLPTHSVAAPWRDIKVRGSYAFIVADWADAHGMQVFDLTQLRNVNSPPVTFSETAHYAGFQRAHNVVIDEVGGFAYATGSESCNGGLHMIDIQVPTAPTFAGCYANDGYTHDAQCVVYTGPDVEHQGRQICFASNEDTLTIVDVTDKANPLQLSRTSYPNAEYVHQGWLTDDHEHWIHDDELDEFRNNHNTRTFFWDLADLDAPVVDGFFDSTKASIDHNQYIAGDHAFQANYSSGLRILDISSRDPSEFKEVAFLDTHPEDEAVNFDGAWTAFPYFSSGTILISDINRGLFVVRARLVPPLFEDDFESGDTGAWSLESP